MPRQRDETEQEWMDRLRQERGLPALDADNMMERTRAAVCYVNTTNSEASRMNAFLAIFHPEIAAGTPEHLSLMQDARARDSGR